jgi:glyoxylase-like metal-dependent hydrolase (beta-lactamase superfamily II)
MHKISRRNLVLSATAASAAFGLDGPLEFIGSAQAQSYANAKLVDKGFHKFKSGDLEVIQIYDGVWNRPLEDGFVKNASTEQVKGALKGAGMADNIVPTPFTVTVVKIKGEYVMFDAGTGGQFSPATTGLLAAKNMKAAGVDPASIKTIVVTHFHPDHIFGLMAKDTNAQIYPNATIYVPKPELAWWTGSSVPQPAQGLSNRIKATLPGWKNVQQIDGDMEVVPGVRAVATPGHTPGHTSYLVGSAKRPLLVLGDVTNIPVLFAKNPGWQAVFDTDGALAESNRRKIIDRAIAEKLTVTGYHYSMPGAGTFKKDGSGYAFVPVKA